MRWIFYILLFSIVFGNVGKSKYQIKLYGINVAICTVITSDTLLNQKECTKIEYKVKSTDFMNMLFNVDNYYLTIIDNENFSIKYYKKNTTQPNIDNNLETEELNNRIIYLGTEYQILNNEYNIFSFLYRLATKSFIDYKSSFIIDREGKKYNAKLIASKDDYELIVNEIDLDSGIIEHTDIFSWALFFPDSKKIIRLNREKNIIQSCKFQKGLLRFTANLIK